MGFDPGFPVWGQVLALPRDNPIAAKAARTSKCRRDRVQSHRAHDASLYSNRRSRDHRARQTKFQRMHAHLLGVNLIASYDQANAKPSHANMAWQRHTHSWTFKTSGGSLKQLRWQSLMQRGGAEAASLT
jgi:hypothetical protein